MHIPSCPDDTTSVYFRELGLEIGAVQLIAFPSGSLCGTPADGFEPCVYVAAQPATYDPPECGCACPA